jgi:hypothetical protein
MTSELGHTVRMMMVGDFWTQFHRLWGMARNGEPYDKRRWSDCREVIADVLASCGLERRASPRRLHDFDDA